MISIPSRTLLASAVAVLALGACNAEKKAATDTPVAKGAVVATVNGAAITSSRIDAIVKQGAAGGRPDTPESRKAIVDGLSVQMIVADEAVKKGLDKSPEVAEQLDMLRQSVLANAYVQDFIKNTPISDDMLKAEYERIKATITGTEYKARHILVEKESEARDIIAKLKKDPASFEKLAMEKSQDPGSKARGGDLGWFDLDRMAPEFKAAVAALEKGKITQEPVKTRYGYHVIQLEDSKPVESPPFEEVKASLAQTLQQQSLKKQVDELKSKAKIEIAGAPPSATAAASAASTK